MQRALKKEAQILRKVIVKGIRNQAPGGKKFKPLADTTKMMKGSSKALIDKSDLINSVNVSDVEGSAIFVGVHRKELGKDGQELWNIAEIQEFGTPKFQIAVTPKMRRWWFAMFRQGIFKAPLKSRTSVINHPGVPERPFLRPSYAFWSKMAEHSFQATMEVFLRRSLGYHKRW
jgi:hypothetical protein